MPDATYSKNVLKPDLSAISPFFIPADEPAKLPKGHKLERVSLLIRHSAILGNDDEYEQTMGPFVEKIYAADPETLPSSGPWAFLRDWECPINEENLEKVSDRGKKDAKVCLCLRLCTLLGRPGIVRVPGLAPWPGCRSLNPDAWQIHPQSI